MEKKTLKKIEKAGNNTDTVVGHLTKGELIVPKVLFDIPEVKQMLQTLFKENNVSLNEFIVGNSENKINMETGYPEFFLGAVVNWGKRVLGVGGGGGKKQGNKNKSNQNNNQQQDLARQMQEQQAAYERQMKAKAEALAKAEEDARKAAEEEKKRRDAAAQSDSARSMALANQAQVATQIGNLSSPVSAPQAQGGTAPQQVKQQAAEAGTGYVPTQQFQGAAIAKSMNEESGGGNVPVNRFISPNTQGLTFGGA